MPKIIPANTITQIIICRLEGRSRKETSQITGVSETKVQQIWNEFRDNVGDANFEALSKIGEFLILKGISFGQWMDEFCIRSRLERLGVKIDANLDSFVDDLFLVCKEYKINPTTIVKEIIDLRNLSSQSSLPIGKLSQHFLEIKSETEKLQQENQQLSQDTTEKRNGAANANKEKVEALAQKKVTLQELNEYVTAKKGLGKFGEAVKDLPTVAKILAEVKNNGWSSLRIIQHLTQKSSYAEQIAKQKTIIDSNNAKISEQNQTIDKQASKMESNDAMIARQVSRINELKRQDAKMVEVFDIRKDLYQIKILQFENYAKEVLNQVQAKVTNAIDQTAKKATEDQEKFFIDQKSGFAEIKTEVSAAVENIALTVQNVASLKAIQPLYRLLFLKASTPEAVRAIMLPLNCFITLYEIDPNFNPTTLSNAKDFQKSLQGDLKRLK